MKDIASTVHPVLSAIFLMALPILAATQDGPMDGGEGIDANGGDDLNDLLNILPVIRALS
jgi:hypothetical protein